MDKAWDLGSTAGLLDDSGPLAAGLPGFAPRVEQQEMAAAVARAMSEYATLICEAGTGTGKTFAYLVPALASGRRVIVSTGTRHLQDQLCRRDVPAVRKALGVSARVAALKGRANYLCRYRLERAGSEAHLHGSRQAGELLQVRAWAARTRSGDIAELASVAEGSPTWPFVTSTADNCLGQECPMLGDCHVLKARRAAQEADLVVINHHLFFADMALREEGFGELLPGANAVVFDEAHQLPEVASLFFGQALSGRQLLELARDTLAESRREAADTGALERLADDLEHAAREMRLVLGTASRRAPWSLVRGRRPVAEAADALSRAIAALTEALRAVASSSKGLESCWRRAGELGGRLAEVLRDAADDTVHWFETRGRGFSLHTTPLDVSQSFRAHLDGQRCAWIFTSATLAVGDSFAHFASRLGLDDALTRRWDSPFDFRRQSLLYIPARLPDPGGSDHTEAVVAASLPVLAASGGRAFMLFTSHRALREAAERLARRAPYPLYVQGTAPKAALLEHFRDSGNGVLLGTSSFWEGVDVRGQALSCVIIDKLPFASPDDPVLQARIEAVRSEGGNPFSEYQLPGAVIALKQGAGRLIRDVDDSGVLVLCDPRLLSRPYGRVFLRSLPPTPMTRDIEAVRDFYRRPDESNQSSVWPKL